MKPWTKFQDWSSLVLGLLLFVAPWLFRTTSSASSSWNAWIVGIVLVALALWELAQPSFEMPEWFGVVLGVWLFLAPWILGFAAVGAAAWTAWIVGILVVVLAAWKVREVRSMHTGNPQHAH